MSLVVYKSSAGSGKTYQLAKEYIRLALRSPSYHKVILAITFTNRAAEEMKSRVLIFLKEIGDGKHELVQVFSQELSLSEKQVSEKATAVLHNILHHYHHFSVFTIDTFFYSIIRSFSKEIGLHGAFEVELDTKKVALKLSEILLSKIEKNTQLEKWLTDYTFSKLIDDGRYDVRQEIITMAKVLFNDDFKQYPQSQFSSEDFKMKLKSLHEKLTQVVGDFLSTLEKKANIFFDITKKYSLEPSEFSRATIPKFYLKLLHRNIKDDLLNATIQSSLENPEKWVTKTIARREFILQIVEKDLMPLLNATINFYQQNLSAYKTALAVKRKLYALGLIADLSKRLEQYRDENEVMIISDMSDFLNQIIRESEVPFVFEKVGARYHHFLIDEFQDTSQFQWNNLKLLLEESMASGYVNYIVGDEKQSIYAFRGGNPTLLMSGVQQDFPQLEHRFLDTNYRSYANIIDFNNQVFSHLPQIVEESLDGTGVSQSITKAYEHVVQQPTRLLGGHIKIEFLTTKHYTSEAIEKTIKLVEDIQMKGYSPNDIAILVRRNVETSRLVDAFVQKKNDPTNNLKCSYEVISAEGMLVTKALSVQLILSVFEYIANIKDGVKAFNLIYKYLEITRSKDLQDHDTLATLNIEGSLPTTFTKYLDHFKQLPTYELVEVLVRIFNLNHLENEIAYLQTFQDAVLEFSKKNTGGINNFLKWWYELEESGKTPSIKNTASKNAIEIISIHKSKGLEFPIVIMPFTSFDFDTKKETTWYDAPHHDIYKDFDALPVQYTKGIQQTLFYESHIREQSKWYLDNLNVLYVAFTRAERALYCFCEIPSKKKSVISTTSDALLEYFTRNAVEGWKQEKEGHSIYEFGELPTPEKEKDETNTGEVRLLHYTSRKWSDRLSVKKKFNITDEHLEATKKRKWGLLLHEIIANINYWKEANIILEQYEKQLKITQEETKEINEWITPLWKNKLIKSWFEENIHVKKEAELLLPNGKYKRVDRIIFDGDDATIIDFKTAKPNHKDIKQVEEYKKLLEEMGYQTKGYLLYLENAQVVQV